jgi:hypothetical protein
MLLVEDNPTDEKLTLRAFDRCPVPLELSYELGANAYLRKPVDFTEFVAAAEILAAFWLELNEPAPEWRSPNE